MNNMKLKAEYMISKTFDYGGRIHYIESIKFNEADEKMIVKTNLEIYTRPYDSAEVFLEQFRPATTLAAVKAEVQHQTGPPRQGDHLFVQQQNESALAKMAEKDTAVADDMIAMLKDNISKVQADPKYIPQAQEINKNVISILNIVKTKMDMARQYSKKR